MKVILSETQFRGLVTEMTSDEINSRANEANTNPSEPQKEAGNYKMGHISVKGMKISIENPKGSYRKYKNENGTTGYNEMKNHYGYFNITKGKDGDAVDVFIGPNIEDFENVYCVDQNNKEGEFDETKVMLGFDSKEEAKEAYMSNYSPDWKGFRDVTGVSLKVFKKWLYRGRKQRQPFADYVEIQKKQLDENAGEGNVEQNRKFREKVEEIKNFVRGLENNGGKPTTRLTGKGLKYDKTNYSFDWLVSFFGGIEHTYNKKTGETEKSVIPFVSKAVARALFELDQEYKEKNLETKYQKNGGV